QDQIPQWVRVKIRHALNDNKERFGRISETYRRIASAFEAEGVEYVVLKGFGQYPDYIPEPHLRIQSDIDIFLPSSVLVHARKVLMASGYEALPGYEHKVLDHLPPMAPTAPWKWRGNFCDPDIPVSWELHKCLWNENRLGVEVQGLGEFWARR